MRYRAALWALGCGLVLFTSAACATRGNDADSTEALTVDTVKPATSTLQPAADSSAGTTEPAAPVQKGQASAKATKAPTDTSSKHGKNIGRDSIIRFPREGMRLPTVDTTKRATKRP